MPRPVLLVPHGKSHEHNGRLKRSGKRSAKVAGETIRALGLEATPTIVTSEAPRYRQTAKRVGKAIGAKTLTLEQPYFDSRGTSKTDRVDVKRTISNWLGKTSHEGSRNGPVIFVVSRDFVAAATKTDGEPGKVNAGSVYSYSPKDGLTLVENPDAPQQDAQYTIVSQGVVVAEGPGTEGYDETPAEPTAP